MKYINDGLVLGIKPGYCIFKNFFFVKSFRVRHFNEMGKMKISFITLMANFVAFRIAMGQTLK